MNTHGTTRYQDVESAGKSVLVPRRRRETMEQRHNRRYRSAIEMVNWVRNKCAWNGWSLRVTNNGQHWQFRFGNRLAEWWPSSAKLIFDKKWKKGVHVHDWEQALKVIGERWGIGT